MTCTLAADVYGIKIVATEIATGRRTKKIKFVKTEFGVATIVIIGNYGKP